MPNPKLETYKNKATGTVYDYTDAAAQAALAGILDGTDIDSFEDVETALATKVDKVTGKGLSTNDYDDTEKAKVAGAFPRSEQAVLGAKNFLPITLAELKSLNSEGTWSDNVYTNANVTYTCTVENGYVTKISLSGTANATNQLRIKDRNRKDYVLEKGTYVLNGCPVSGSTNSYYITASKNKVWNNPSSGFDALGNDVGSGFTYTLSEHAQLGISIQIANGTNTSGLEFKPMISFDGGEYAPYAMTNKELTDKATVKTIAHATAITEGDLSVTFTEYITGNVEQIVGVISSSVDKDIASQSGISIGTALAHKPLSSAEVIGSIDSSLSASDRRPICSIRISNTGRISIDGQMSANRNYTFTITYIFGS